MRDVSIAYWLIQQYSSEIYSDNRAEYELAKSFLKVSSHPLLIKWTSSFQGAQMKYRGGSESHLTNIIFELRMHLPVIFS